MMTYREFQPPEWFKPYEYDRAENFSYRKWTEQISMRYICYSMLVNPLELNFKMSDEIKSTLVDVFEAIKNDIYPDYPEFIISTMLLLKKPFNTDSGNTQNYVWSTTDDEIIDNYATMLSDKNQNSNVIEKLKGSLQTGSRLHQQFNSTGSISFDSKYTVENDIIGRRNVTVDLNGTDKEIKNDFERWLKKEKKEFNNNVVSQIISDAKIKIWVEKRVLAYIDLKLWRLIENKNITDGILFEWLNVLPNYSVEDGKKELVKIEERLMKYETIFRLFNKAYGLKSKQNTHDLLRAMMDKYNIKADDLKR